MPVKRLDHIAVAVKNLDEALVLWRDLLGMPVIAIETVEEQGVRVAKLDTGNTHIELLEPLGPDTPVGRFLEQKGQGLHHVCLEVEDIDSELERLGNKQIKLIDAKARIGAGGARIAFIHPKATGGVLTELSEWPEEACKADH